MRNPKAITNVTIHTKITTTLHHVDGTSSELTQDTAQMIRNEAPSSTNSYHTQYASLASGKGDVYEIESNVVVTKVYP